MRRLGVILPSSNTTVEYEFSKELQATDVSVHYARVSLKDVTVEGLEAMECELEVAARLLADAAVNLVVFACTSGSLIKGRGYDAQLAKRIGKAAGCPALTTSGAVMNAFRALGVMRICLATPYLPDVAAHEVQFLEDNGFKILREHSLGIKDNLEIGRLTANDAQTLARAVFVKGTDAVFISCTNFRTFEAIDALEKDLGKPVVSSNSATLWAAMNLLKLEAGVSLGQLFSAKPISK